MTEESKQEECNKEDAKATYAHMVAEQHETIKNLKIANEQLTQHAYKVQIERDTLAEMIKQLACNNQSRHTNKDGNNSK